MTRAGLRLLAIVLLALAVGFVAGWRANITFGGSHHRWMAPPVPADLAFYSQDLRVAESRPSLVVVSPSSTYPTTSGPDSRLSVAGSTPDRPAAGQALRGISTWYATGPSCLCAAAGPALRHGHWRGSTVTVRANGRLIEVKLIDACWCRDRSGLQTLLDLSAEAFAQLAPLERGVVEVEVTR